MRPFTVLVGDDRRTNWSDLSDTVAEVRISPVFASDAAQVLAVAQASLPDLVILDLDLAAIDGLRTVRLLRAAPPPLSSVPVLFHSARVLEPTEVYAMGFDEQLPARSDPAAVDAAIACWCRTDMLDGVERLGGTFGEAAIASLVASLHEELVAAVEELDRAINPETAHRIAGFAGTIGFPDVSRTWLKLSVADETTRDAARREARLAVAAIARAELLH